MLELEDSGLIFDATQQPPERRIAFFTSLCKTASGRLLCGFQNGPAKHAPTSTARLCFSDNEGCNWQPLPTEFQTDIGGVPGSLAGVELVEVAPRELLALATWFDRSDPGRPLFDPVTEGILKSKLLFARSTDDGVTWSAWDELPTAGLKGCALTGPVVRWSDGTIGVPFESFKEYDDPTPGRHAAWLTISRDRGRTFLPPRLVAQHPEHRVFYWDQRLCVTGDSGGFAAMFWTHDLVAGRDLNVHFRRGRVSGESLDLEPLVDTRIQGQIAAPLALDAHRVLAFVVDRVRPATMSLRYSPDGGNSWPLSQRVVIYRHDEQAAVSAAGAAVDFKQYWEDMGKWSFGHPALCRLDANRVLLAWYAGTPDRMSLHWCRVRLHEGTP